MKRTTIFIDEALETDLRMLAQRQGRPAGALVRDAVARYVQEQKKKAPALPSFVAIGKSGRSDTAEKHEELLWQTLSPHDGVTPKSKGRRNMARRRSSRA